MKHKLKIVAMDPSMSNWGLAIGYYNLKDGSLEIPYLEVVKPDKFKDLKIRKNSKHIRVVEQLVEGIIPHLEDADIIMAEVPIGGQDANACVSYAMCVSIIATVNVAFTKIIEVSPNDVKMIVEKNASKAQMIEWAVAQHPEANWKYKTIKGITSVVAGHAEHVADAIATMYAASYTPEFNKLINSFKGKEHEISSTV